MNISDLLIPELEHEAQLIETFLKRIPEDKLEWTPHEKSMPLGTLAAHLVEIVAWIPATMDEDTLEMSNYQPPKMGGVDGMLAELHRALPAAKQSLQKDNEVYFQTWTMKQGEQILMQMPRYNAIRSAVFNQFPHHRAQLGVYLRLLDISVPATYGPSADESG